jgi:hypothetical protein
MAKMPVSDLRGLSRLAVDGVVGVSEVAQSVQQGVLRAIPGRAATPLLAGTDLAYRGVRGVARLVGRSVDGALARVAPLLGEHGAWPGREATVAFLNGVLGDHLDASGNPLRIAMRLRRGGEALTLTPEALAAALPAAGGHLLVSLHGLCMNDLALRRNGHDHAAALEDELGCAAVYLHYNSGRHVSHNGRELARQLDALLAAWPVPVTRLDLLCHSMGGLVARSACHYAERQRLGWRGKLDKLVFLGTPHHGAPLERGSSWLPHLVGDYALAAPLARLVQLRSAGIADLGYGNLRDSDWQADGQTRPGDRRTPTPLPRGVQCYALAGSVVKGSEGLADTLGDGLVPLGSALGRHADAAFDLRFPAAHQAVLAGVHHLGLLDSPQAYEQVRAWLASRRDDVIDV